MVKPMRRFHMKRSLFKKHQLWYVAGFLIINLAACIIIGNHAYRQIQADMNAHALQSQEEVPLTACICIIGTPIYTAGIRPMSNMKKADMMPQHVRGTAMQWMRRVKSCSLRRI